MPGRYSTRRRYSGPRAVVTSIKNMGNFQGSTSATRNSNNIAKAVTAPSPTVSTDVSHGCLIKAIWLSLDYCGTLGSGVANSVFVYLIKNPGANLTAPDPKSAGTSNEKKFIIRFWSAMVMRNQDGNNPYHWEGWVKIPKRYHRMGTDDLWTIVAQNTTSGTGLQHVQFIYKWYR